MIRLILKMEAPRRLAPSAGQIPKGHLSRRAETLHFAPTNRKLQNARALLSTVDKLGLARSRSSKAAAILSPLPPLIAFSAHLKA